MNINMSIYSHVRINSATRQPTKQASNKPSLRCHIGSKRHSARPSRRPPPETVTEALRHPTRWAPPSPCPPRSPRPRSCSKSTTSCSSASWTKRPWPSSGSAASSARETTRGIPSTVGHEGTRRRSQGCTSTRLRGTSARLASGQPIGTNSRPRTITRFIRIIREH